MSVVMVAVAVVAVLAGLLIVLIRSERSKGRLTAEVVSAFEASMNRLGERWTSDDKKTVLPNWTVTRSGRSWDAGFSGGSRGPPHFWITTELDIVEDGGGTPFRRPGQAPLAHPPRLRLRREHGRDRAGKRLRLNRELQLGDRAFDEAVYIESDDDDELLLKVLASPRLRAAVLALLETGCDHIALYGAHGPLELRWSGNHDVNPFHDRKLDHIMIHFEQVASELPTFARERATSDWPRGARELGTTIAVGVAGIALFALGMHLYRPLELSQLMSKAIPVGLCAALLVTTIVFFRARGTSRALRMLGWTVGLSIPCWPMFVAGTMLTLNGALDGPPIVRNVFVERTYTSRSKNGVNHYAALRPWPPHEKIDIRLTEQQARRVHVGPRIIRVGQGALGIAWFAGLGDRR